MKLLFEYNLNSIYQEIYYLCKYVGFDPFYVESITPIERKIYWNYYEKEKEEEKKNKSGQGDVLSMPDNMQPLM